MRVPACCRHHLLILCFVYSRPPLRLLYKKCEVCEATYEWGRTEESRMLICEDCGEGYHLRCVGRKNVPKGEWRCHACE